MTRLCRGMAALLFTLVMAVPAAAAEKQTAQIGSPYLDMYAGPGRGYPVLHVIEQGQSVELTKRRTSWVKVRTLDRHQKIGWVRVADLERALDTETHEMADAATSLTDAANRRWEWSVSGGDFAGASAITAAIGFNLTPNISVQGRGTQIFGEFSEGLVGSAHVQLRPFPQWRISPWFEIGAGVLSTEPFSTIVNVEARSNPVLSTGAGFNVYLTRHFIMTAGYRRHTVLTERVTNEEIDEWKLGIGAFF